MSSIHKLSQLFKNITFNTPEIRAASISMNSRLGYRIYSRLITFTQEKKS